MWNIVVPPVTTMGLRVGDRDDRLDAFSRELVRTAGPIRPVHGDLRPFTATLSTPITCRQFEAYRWFGGARWA
jgi:hypothetical protein